MNVHFGKRLRKIDFDAAERARLDGSQKRQGWADAEGDVQGQARDRRMGNGSAHGDSAATQGEVMLVFESGSGTNNEK